MIGQLLKQARLKAKMTQEQLARKACVTREYVSLLESDKRVPTITVFIRLSHTLGVSPADLIHSFEEAMSDHEQRS